MDQYIFHVPSFTLECGVTLTNASVAYKTWGKLNEARDNVMIICHAFTGSTDVEDWWGPLMGRGKAFDPHRFFIVCCNSLGSPYGSASPLTVNPDTGKLYGPEFPPTSIRDDVRIHKHVLDYLSISFVAVVIGGSMGGMAVLEWPLCTPPNYIRRIIPLATSARHSAWCISWGEAQRQCIYSDPDYLDGYYDFGEDDGRGGGGEQERSLRKPARGLAAARMAALLTYRSRDSFERRFGRRAQHLAPHASAVGSSTGSTPTALSLRPGSPMLSSTSRSSGDDAAALHNDGLRNGHGHASSRPQTPSSTTSAQSDVSSVSAPKQPPPIFSAQSYLRYQGDKFTARFDANCYIHITRKLDTHDLARDREPSSASSSSSSPSSSSSSSALTTVLASLPPRALIISIASDGLFTPLEQRQLAEGIPGSELVTIESEDGHDGFLLEFERINGCVLRYLRREFPEYYVEGVGNGEEEGEVGGFEVRKTSVFGEAEADVARW